MSAPDCWRGTGCPRVLERDTDRHARTRGGSLDLGQHGGLRAVREMGLEGEFAALARPAGQQVWVLDSPANLLLSIEPDDWAEARPEVDRVALRAMLLDSVPAGALTWGATVEAVAALPGGGYRIELAGREPHAPSARAPSGSTSRCAPRRTPHCAGASGSATPQRCGAGRARCSPAGALRCSPSPHGPAPLLARLAA